MKKNLPLIAIVLLITLTTGLFNNLPKTDASTFSQAYLRLDNMKPNASLSGTVCAQPFSAGGGTENSVTITFPTDFSLSTTLANWTTNTSNLPSDSTAWPGIGTTATSVSGQSVTFSSADLTSATSYCFNFTATGSTTGSVGNDKTGTITTKNASNATIDSITYAVSIVSSNQIAVTARVDPHASDLPITIASTTAGSQFPQSTTLSYKITYGTNTTTGIPLTIQAQWNQGTIAGSPTPSVDILDYAIGSATNAYNSTPPVIDNVNRTITWTISSIPQGTNNQTVSFSLKTNSSYTGSSNVSFDISTRAISGGTVTPDQTVTQNYLYSGTSTTTSTTTASPTPTPTTTPTPTLTPKTFSFSDISIHSLSQSEAQISVTTNNKSVLTIQYGTSPNSLSQTVTTLSYQGETLITLSSMEPNKDYYFKVTAKDQTGNTVKSDIFTFKTATVSQAPTVNQQTIIVTSNNTILVNPSVQDSKDQNQKNTVVIPQSTTFEIHFSLDKNVTVKSIQAIVRNKRVLGLSTLDKAEASSNFVELMEIQPGTYTGKLKSQPISGVYEIYVRIIDYNGNISEQKIADLTVTPEFTVYEKGTNRPIENARVLLYIYNEKTRLYKLISPAIIPIPNPVYSQSNGIVSVVLPPGRYKAEVSAISFEPQTQEFEISEQTGGYPSVYLKSQPLNVLNTVSYLGSTLSDILSAYTDFLRQQTSSNRLFNLSAYIALAIFILISFLSFSAKTHIPILSTPYFFVYKIRLLIAKTKKNVIFGKIIDEKSKDPVSKANVYVIDSVNNSILAHLKTNKLGEFYFKKPENENYKISVMKKGFLPSPFFEYTKENINIFPLMLNLKKDEGHIKSLFEIWLSYTEGLLGIMLEFILVLTIVFEVFFTYTFGPIRILPFLFISTLNVILLFLFLYKPRKLQNAIPKK